MPLTLPVGDQVQGFVTVGIITPPATTPVLQSALPAGQSVQPLISPDTNTFTVTMDSPPVTDPNSPTVASFLVKSAPTPAQPNVALPITLNILNSDGSVAATATDTVTVSETAKEVVGDLFGTPVVIPA